MVSGGPADERLDDPDVETVESDDEEGWDGWPSRAWCWGSSWLLGAETERLSWRNWGVLLKAYGAMGAGVAL